jgi:hypothetical protein
MADELIDFVWRIPTAGYQWISAECLGKEESPQRYLVYASGEPVQPARDYSPFVSTSGLFKRFAETAPTEKGIAAFANKFGWLGGRLTSGPLSAAEGTPRLYGETFNSWQETIKCMADIVTLWECAKLGKLSAISRQVFWKGNAVFHRSRDRQNLEVIASEHLYPELLAGFSRGDLQLPAMYAVQRQINRELAKHTASPKLLWHRGQLVLRQSATSLIGAIWLQFAKAVEGNKGYRQCENCREWIEIGGRRAARSDKRFCTPSCKSAAWQRDAKLRALEQASKKGR